MARDANSIIRKVLDIVEVAADVRKQVKDREHRDAPRTASVEEHRITDEDLSTMATDELYERLTIALAEIADIGEELAQRSGEQER